MASVRRALVLSGVKQLKDYGYPKCDERNILTDRIYAAFFSKMLEGTAEDKAAPKTVRDNALSLLAEIKETK
jgi:hypothetical protein